MIKSVFLAALAAVVTADADPQFLGLPYVHGFVGHALPVAHAVPHHAVVKSVIEVPAVVTKEVTAHEIPLALGYHGYGYGLGHGYGLGLGHAYGGIHHIGKRSADAAILDGHTKVLTAPTPLIHNPPAIHHPLALPHALPLHAGYGLGYGLGFHGLAAGHYLAKRDADAAVLDGHTKVLTPPTPLIHNPPLIHHPAYLAPAPFYALNPEDFLAHAPLLAHAEVTAPVAVAAYGLGHYGLAAGHYIGKREADAQVLLHSGLALPYAHHALALPYTHHALAFPVAHSVPRHPVVKSVVESPAEVATAVTEHHVPVALGYHHGLLGHHGYAYGYHG